MTAVTDSLWMTGLIKEVGICLFDVVFSCSCSGNQGSVKCCWGFGLLASVDSSTCPLSDS